jgi:hypothetical protein
MFCGGSFRTKTVEEHDQYRIVKVNNAQVKIFRSVSLSKADRPQKVFVSPPRVPRDGNEAVSARHP